MKWSSQYPYLIILLLVTIVLDCYLALLVYAAPFLALAGAGICTLMICLTAVIMYRTIPKFITIDRNFAEHDKIMNELDKMEKGSPEWWAAFEHGRILLAQNRELLNTLLSAR
jgi:small-conductance mechanosensitive channel